MVKTAPVAAFKMTQAKLLFEFLVIALDAPAQFGSGHQLAKTEGRGQIGQPVFGWCLLLPGPFDQQPLFGTRLAALVIAMRDTYPQGGEAGAHLTMRALAPGDGC